MLKRKLDIVLQEWKNTRKQALLITGSRQIGKTTSIDNFAKSNFVSYIYLNFAIRPDLIDSFATLKNYEQLLIRLSAFEGAKMIPGKTVVFFDEIQLLYKRREDLKKQGLLDPNSMDIITAMKPISIDAEYRFILSGSLLGISINDVLLNPTGYMDTIQMFPLDFEEYLWAKNVGIDAIEYVKKCFKNHEEVDEALNNMFLDYFNEYVLIGGMPEAVDSFIKNKNLHLVEKSQEQIINNYRFDITTYIYDEGKKLRIREIFDSIPSELNNRNKRIVSSHVVDKNYLKNENLNDEFLWLTNAAVAIPVYNVSNAEIPLSLTSERKTMKLFMNDIGLLGYMLLSTGIREKLLNNEKEINYGAPFENVIAQELYSHGFRDRIYYYNSKKHGEVDFLIEYNNEVLPIEVKSGKPNEMNVYNHTALNNLMSLYHIPLAYVFGECNVVKESERVIQLPIYMISFVNKK